MKLINTDITVLRPDGSHTEYYGLDLPEEPPLKVIQAYVMPHIDGDDDMERVNVFWNGMYTDMFVGEFSAKRGLPVNIKATEIYRNNMLTHVEGTIADEMPMIYGTAVLFSRRVWF